MCKLVLLLELLSVYGKLRVKPTIVTNSVSHYSFMLFLCLHVYSYGDAPHNVIFISRSFNCSGNESHLLDCASVSIPFGSMCRSPYDIVGIKCGECRMYAVDHKILLFAVLCRSY